MKTRKDELLTIFLFCGFLTAMLLGCILLPKEEFSEKEKRYLEKAPAFTWENLSSGQLGEDIESYMADHLPGRDFLVGLNAYVDLWTGRQWGKDIYVFADDRLVEAPVKWEPSKAQKNMNMINQFADGLGRNVDLMLVPSAGWAAGEQEALYQDEAMIRDIYAMAGENLNTVNLLDTYRGRSDLYFKTDHHWNARGAYEGYQAYRQYLGKPWVSEEEFEIGTYGEFRGSTYSRSGLWLTPAEPLELWQGSENLTVTNDESSEPHPGVFYWERLEEADKYTVNLDGNHPLVRIENPNGQGKLLVIRDSYSNSLGTFLAESWETVVLVDLRYYKEPVSELAAREGFDDILVCYSIGNFMTDGNMVWLR